VTDADARRFYETEAVRGNWSHRDLERQINSLYHQRLLASNDKIGMLQSQRQSEQPLRAVDILNDPYVLEFLDLPSTPQFHESELEDAIITQRGRTAKGVATRARSDREPCQSLKLVFRMITLRPTSKNCLHVSNSVVLRRFGGLSYFASIGQALR
jgi:hypothetical protein